MRKKEKKVIVTFENTTEAMAMESICRKYAVNGRLIPVPREITSGCGMAWCSDIEYKNELLDFIRLKNICHEAVYEVDF